jgi:dolichol-phosphate mannosyltransferase
LSTYPHNNHTPVADGGVFILLPVLNEVSNIGPLLDKIEAELSGVLLTVGILDDGSTDGTLEYLRERVRCCPDRLHLICRTKTLRASQRGSALRTLMEWGLKNTSHEIFIEMDGDLSHRPEELSYGIGLLRSRTLDVAIASKYANGSAVVNRPWGRRIVSKICSYAVRGLLSRRVRDYSNGYRFYTRSGAQLAADHIYRYGSPIYLSEILALWMRSGLRVGEFKSIYIGRNEGISKLRLADLAKAGIAVFEIAARYHVFGFKRLPSSAVQEIQEASRSKAAKSF